MNSSFLLMNQARSMDLSKEDRDRLYTIWRMGNHNLLIPLMKNGPVLQQNIRQVRV